MHNNKKAQNDNLVSKSSEEQIISTKNGKRYVLEALKNAKQFLHDAEVLIRNGSYAHAAALAALGIEEAVKAKIAMRHTLWDGRFEVDVKTYQEEIRSHFSKLSKAATDYMATTLAHHLVPQGSCTLQELHQRLKQTMEKEEEFLTTLEIEGILYASFAILKEKWLYVDVEKGEVTTPLTWSKEDAKKVLSMAQRRLQEYEADIVRNLE